MSFEINRRARNDFNTLTSLPANLSKLDEKRLHEVQKTIERISGAAQKALLPDEVAQVQTLKANVAQEIKRREGEQFLEDIDPMVEKLAEACTPENTKKLKAADLQSKLDAVQQIIAGVAELKAKSPSIAEKKLYFLQQTRLDDAQKQLQNELRNRGR